MAHFVMKLVKIFKDSCLQHDIKLYQIENMTSKVYARLGKLLRNEKIAHY